MNLAKWLAINQSVKPIGGTNRFVLPSTGNTRFEFTSLKQQEKNLHRNPSPLFTSNEVTKTTSVNRNEKFESTGLNISEKRLFPSNHAPYCGYLLSQPVISLPDNTKDTINRAGVREGDQLTLDGWKDR